MNSRAKGLGAVVGAAAVVALLALPKLRSLTATPASTGAAAGTPRDQGIAVSTQVIRAERLGDRIATIGTVLPNEEVDLRSEIPARSKGWTATSCRPPSSTRCVRK